MKRLREAPTTYCVENRLDLYRAARAPRYTSYPSALRFTPEITDRAYREALAGVGAFEPLSLYVHVPFCRKLCWYCGCNMQVENVYSRASRYVDSLLVEIESVGAALSGRGRPTSVHFGGGTPNYLAVDDLRRVLEAIECAIGLTDDVRLAIELDPRLIEEGDVVALAGAGFSRMSLGVQDFDPAVQAAINRIQSFDSVESAVSAMRAARVDDVSFDLLYGLPRQTPESFRSTLDAAIALSPDRLAVFGYAHLPQTVPRQRMIDEAGLPGPAMRAELATAAHDALVSAGYVAVGFDHFAKPDNALAVAQRAGRLRRNFQGFTEDPASATLGLGASAVSFVGGLYAQNEKRVDDYREAVAARGLATGRGVRRTARDERYARVIMDLLCERQADLSQILQFADPAERAALLDRIEALSRDGLVALIGGRIVVRRDGLQLTRAIAAAIDPYASEMKALSGAV